MPWLRACLSRVIRILFTLPLCVWLQLQRWIHVWCWIYETLSENVLREDYPSRPNGARRPSITGKNLNSLFRASEMYLSISVPTRNMAQSAVPPPASTFSTSTPSQVRFPPAPFDPSPAPTQPLTQASVPITPARHPHAPSLYVQPEDVRTMEVDLEYQEGDVLVTARACFEAGEFMRVIHLLRGCRSSKARFLSIYSHFIVSSINLHGSHTRNNSTISRPVKKKPNAIGTNSIVRGFPSLTPFPSLCIP